MIDRDRVSIAEAPHELDGMMLYMLAGAFHNILFLLGVSRIRRCKMTKFMSPEDICDSSIAFMLQNSTSPACSGSNPSFRSFFALMLSDFFFSLFSSTMSACTSSADTSLYGSGM